MRSKNGVPIRLTNERWNHIITSHVDMKDNKEMLLKTVEDPDMILRGVLDELRAVKFFEIYAFRTKVYYGSIQRDK